LATLKQASGDLAQGHLGASLFFVLLLGGAYGSLHAIGPGHGKFAVAGYAMGSSDGKAPLLRVVAGAGLAHVAGAALILLVALMPALAAGGTLPVEHWTRPIQGRDLFGAGDHRAVADRARGARRTRSQAGSCTRACSPGVAMDARRSDRCAAMHRLDHRSGVRDSGIKRLRSALP